MAATVPHTAFSPVLSVARPSGWYGAGARRCPHPAAGRYLDTLEALDKEVEAIHAWAVERAAHEAIEAEQFQVFSQVVTEVRQVIDKHRTTRR